ncbi:hypothetical protein EVAR_66401_1 [Eumeta japonica]|uniref:Uncharacterized protein n=1 Tax=Eumeta variegata TaxID=151549 RepID=A0A4C2A208_EUMVA|nr:hypothetical protein EVAR_66401_1 [Eumeta japonica]
MSSVDTAIGTCLAVFRRGWVAGPMSRPRRLRRSCSPNDATVCTSAGGIWVFVNLCNSPECHTRSNAFSISRKIPTVRRLRLCLAAMWCRTRASWNIVECPLAKPKLFLSRCQVAVPVSQGINPQTVWRCGTAA